jgi:hypothetical protein
MMSPWRHRQTRTSRPGIDDPFDATLSAAAQEFDETLLAT